MSDPPSTEIDRAAEVLRRGGLVAFPTETVYGLGADATNAEAVARLFAAKDRPRFDPVIVHLAAPEDLEPLVTAIPPVARTLIERFWPGPLTLVLPKTESVPDIVTAGRPTVAVRMPDHALALSLIAAAGRPIAAPSANRFGRLSPTRAEHVAEQLGDRVELILDDGPCQVGIESTVLDLAGPGPRLLRPGATTLEALNEIIGPVDVHPGTAQDEPLASPGMLPRHYAPRTPLELVDDVDRLPPGRLGLLTLTAARDSDRFELVEVLAADGDLVTAAAGFFAALQHLDAAGLDRILAVRFPDNGLGRAINDRLERAAAR